MGELARKPGAPELGKTALEILSPRPGKKPKPFEEYLLPAAGVFCGVLGVNISNRFKNRPMYAGIYRHVIIGVAAWYFMALVRDLKKEADIEKNAVLKHYVTLHPEEFPPIERKRIGELFKEWTPIR